MVSVPLEDEGVFTPPFSNFKERWEDETGCKLKTAQQLGSHTKWREYTLSRTYYSPGASLVAGTFDILEWPDAAPIYAAAAAKIEGCVT